MTGVKAARAFTGWHQRDGEFRFVERSHDSGTKRVLGAEGNLGGEPTQGKDDVVLEEDEVTGSTPAGTSSENIVRRSPGLAKPVEFTNWTVGAPPTVEPEATRTHALSASWPESREEDEAAHPRGR